MASNELQSEKYREYLQSSTWQSKRLAKLRTGLWSRGHCLCERCCCLVHQCGIEVHHLTYERLGDELLEDLQIVCNGCHAQIHGKPTPPWWKGDSSRDDRYANLLAGLNLRVAAGESAADAFEVSVWHSVPVISSQEIMDDRLPPYQIARAK